MSALDQLKEVAEHMDLPTRIVTFVLRHTWNWFLAAIGIILGVGIGIDYWLYAGIGAVATYAIAVAVILIILILVMRTRWWWFVDDDLRRKWAEQFAHEKEALVEKTFPGIPVWPRNIKLQSDIELLLHWYLWLALQNKMASPRDLWKNAKKQVAESYPQPRQDLVHQLADAIYPLVSTSHIEERIWHPNNPIFGEKWGTAREREV